MYSVIVRSLDNALVVEKLSIKKIIKLNGFSDYQDDFYGINVIGIYS